jgi:cytochrome c-type biogenesis protein CcmE
MSPESEGAAPAQGAKPARKPRLGRILPVVLAIVVISLVLVVGTWGMWGGSDYPSVKDVVSDKGKYLNKYLEMRGTVKLQSLDVNNTTFVLFEDKSEIRVNYTGILPQNFEEGKDVVVKGTLRDENGLVIKAKEIVVGCASKY